MKAIQILLFIFLSSGLLAQGHIVGVVVDENNNPLIGANIYIKGSYNGTTSGTNGDFKLAYTSDESIVLVVSFIGYKAFEKHIANSPKENEISVQLEPEAGKLDEVVISAGTFEAGDKKRAVLLSAIDVATTASSDADIYGALSTFPGTQKQGESGKIIVRGGDTHETKTYIDGMLVSSPYYSSMPDLPSRGRFSPFMFNGIMFSTGGYSAEYGQALSSVLELKTPGIFDEDLTSISLMNLGVGLSHTKRDTRSAYSLEGFYSNLIPFFMMAQNDLDWEKAPEGISSNFMHRLKIGKTGMIKSSINYNYSKSKLNYPSDVYSFNKVGLTNQNLLYTTTYNTELNKNWMLKSGIAYNNNKDNTEVNTLDIDERLSTFYARLGLVNFFNENITYKFGGEAYQLQYEFGLFDSNTEEDVLMNPTDLLMTGYFESDIKISKKLAIRIGARGEYSSLTKKQNIAPRTSIAYRVSKASQFSLASGTFYQQANPEYLKYTNKLNYEKANHYILNYQYQKEKRILRTELYYKSYDNLITYQVGDFAEFEQLENNGTGYARGIDIFWRDNKSFKYTDYWISYSFIDSKRKFKDYPLAVTPDFVTAHNVSVVYKRWFNKINSQVSLAYNFLSGRPYHSPYKNEFMSETTKSNHDISGNMSYVTNLFGYFTVVHLSVSNLLGLENTYSYRYSENPNQQGDYIETPIKSMTRRTIIIGVFISFK